MVDPHHLQGFVDAQQGVYRDVTAELRDGRTATHWMWFTFPQLRGLGRTPTAEHFETAHGCCATSRDNRTDTLKLRSSMTLFALLRP